MTNDITDNERCKDCAYFLHLYDGFCDLKKRRTNPYICRCDYWTKERPEHNTNKAIFNIDKEEDYLQALIYYISGMTDNYAIKMFNKIINF